MVLVRVTIDTDALRDMAKQINDKLGPKAVSVALGTALGRTKQFAIDTVAEQVSALYNIDEGDVKSSNTKGNTVDVFMSAGGADGAIAEIKFMGRVLTLDHFDFSPRVPPKGRYTVTGTVYRGSSKTLGGHNIFVPRSGKITKIPFMRTGRPTAATKRTTHKTAIEAVRTVSIPQMILNECLEAPIRKAVGERLIEEFARQFEGSGV